MWRKLFFLSCFQRTFFLRQWMTMNDSEADGQVVVRLWNGARILAWHHVSLPWKTGTWNVHFLACTQTQRHSSGVWICLLCLIARMAAGKYCTLASCLPELPPSARTNIAYSTSKSVRICFFPSRKISSEAIAGKGGSWQQGMKVIRTWQDDIHAQYVDVEPATAASPFWSVPCA